MTVTKKYSTARAFRVALEARLKQIADNEKIDLQRLRRLVAFDRLLARIFQNETKRWVLKGGYAMELRMKEARTTKDIDLVIEDPKQIGHHNESFPRRYRESHRCCEARGPGLSLDYSGYDGSYERS